MRTRAPLPTPAALAQTLAATARTAAALCEANDVMIFLVQGDSLVLVAKHGRVPTTRRPGEAFALGRDTIYGRAVIDRRTIHVPDLAVAVRTSFPALRERQRASGVRTLLATPLLHGDHAIGVIVIRRTRVRRFTARHIGLLKTFADQAALAIDNAHLSAELEASNAALQAKNRDLGEALEQQTATAEILRVISSSPTDVQPVLDAVAESAARLCEARDALIWLKDGEALFARAHHGPILVPRESATINSRWVTGRAVIERRPIHVDDLMAAGDEFPEGRALAVQAGNRTTLAVPLLREGEAIGAILIRRAEVRPFSDKHMALLQTFADQAVIAIENVRLFKELERRNRDLGEALEQQTATAEILRVISSSPTNLQPALDAIATNAARVCGAHDATVLLREGDFVRRVAHHGPIDSARPDLVRIDRSFASNRAILDGEPVHIHDLPAVEGPDLSDARDSAQYAGFHTLLAVPLFREGEAIGSLTIRRREVEPFTDKQVALLQTFADQAVIAIENVRLLTDLQARTRELTRSVEQLQALGEVGQAVSSSLDLETVLHTIASRANELAGTDACTVQEYDEEAGVFHQRATHDVPEEVAAIARARPIRKGEGLVGRLPLSAEPVQIVDIAEPGAYRGPLREPLLRAGIRAVLAIPLLREDHLIGALSVLRTAPGEFSPGTVELLKTFAIQSAIAIQNARLFREIEAKGRQLEIASQHKSQFLANMSHELRTPLNAILGYTELIADSIYGEVPERMQEVLDRVDKSGRHLLGLINDILDLSKIEAGQLRLAPVDYSMEDVVRSAAVAAEPLAAEKRLELAVTVAPDLPLGWGDARRLTQVLLNLVGNAVKFTDAGRVAVRAEAAGDAFVVSVTDTGPGIAESDRERIFEEFQQAETTTRKARGGTGLGLAIARRIIEMHGGRLWVESTLGQGSTFSFTVPLRAGEPGPTTRSPAG
jgi:signal transduction histidine kinase/putative methionine-R-sulfoxide reductase with GAF domain